MCKICEQNQKDLKFKAGLLHIADKIAKMSHDNSVKVGAMFNDTEGEIINYGYNGIPRRVNNTPERKERPEKYKWGEHAERNTIYNVTLPLTTGKIMLSTHFPDMEGARAAASVGISKFFVPKTEFDNLEKLFPNDDQETTRVITLFSEADIELNYIDLESTSLNKFDLKISQHLKILMEFAGINSMAPVKRGSILLDPNTLAPVKHSVGFNSPPKLLNLTEDDLLDPSNAKYIIASEKASIYNIAKQSLRGSTLTASWFPCFDCGLAIAYVEAKEVVSRPLNDNDPDDDRWRVSFEESRKLFESANIKISLLNIPKVDKALSFDDTTVLKKSS